MTNITLSGHTHGKSQHHNVSDKDCSNGAKIDNSVIVKLDNEISNSLARKDHEEEEKPNNSNSSLRKKITTYLLLIVCILSQFYVSFMMVSFVLPSLYSTPDTNDYEAIPIIDINSDSEKTRYEHVIMDTSDIYIEQEYDYETLSFKNTQVSKEYNISFLEKKSRFSYYVCFKQCTNVPEILRFDCHPEDGASELSCMNRRCCWNPLNRDIQNETAKRVPLNIPYCYYPENWTLYKYVNYSQDESNFSGFLSRKMNSVYKNDVPLVKIEATGIDSSILRVKV